MENKPKEKIEAIVLEIARVMKQEPLQKTAFWVGEQRKKENHTLDLSVRKLLSLIDEEKGFIVKRLKDKSANLPIEIVRKGDLYYQGMHAGLDLAIDLVTTHSKEK